LGDDVFEEQWYENDGECRDSVIAARCDPRSGMTARERDAWCEMHWRRWGLIRQWTGLPPELPLVRWVETWFFDVPMQEFDAETDVELTGYPARPVVDVDTGCYL
jgi:hypothetical protein